MLLKFLKVKLTLNKMVHCLKDKGKLEILLNKMGQQTKLSKKEEFLKLKMFIKIYKNQITHMVTIMESILKTIALRD